MEKANQTLLKDHSQSDFNTDILSDLYFFLFRSDPDELKLTK